MKSSNDDFVRERAERMGLTLSDEDVNAIRKKWEDTPLCNLDDLIKGVRMLREKRTAEMLTLTNEMIQNLQHTT